MSFSRYIVNENGQKKDKSNWLSNHIVIFLWSDNHKNLNIID